MPSPGSSSLSTPVHPVDQLIALFSQNHHQVSHRSIPITSFSTNKPLLDQLKNYVLRNYNQPRFLLSILASTLGIYILLPTIWPYSAESKHKMLSSKRPDKYTTGLINVTVDCFANSTLQSLASIPLLNNYLNEMIELDMKLTNPGVKNNSDPSIPLKPSQIPLHVALMELLSKLQETVYTSRVVSVWEFLHVIEDIHQSRISRNQHDAQELLQLILETLEKEYLKLSRLAADIPPSLPNNTATAPLSTESTSTPTSTSSDELSTGNEKTTIPKFPFAAELSSSLRCLKCGHSSSANYDHMMILSLNTPQDSSIDLETLLKRTETVHARFEDPECGP
ncbi:unnamed protein product [Ambrosiozyma monospora]|uniref:Unnamed protein product n=1 Tax=Ambrosiozyma monospora TaxID=43982 RepID=A0ACB5U6B8_AMBMO|nr:unnamed protein product [Ambrosiozyma monospora]